MCNTIKITLTFLFLISSFTFPSFSYADRYEIIPQDKAKIFRKIGETVYVACKNNGTLNTKCLVDCGNGKRFEKINGFCTYLEPGIYQLNISILNKDVNPFHTATVTVTKNTLDMNMKKNNRAVASKKNDKPHPHTHNTDNKFAKKNNQTKAVSTKNKQNINTQSQMVSSISNTQDINDTNTEMNTNQQLISTPSALDELGLIDTLINNDDMENIIPNDLTDASNINGIGAHGQNLETIKINTIPSIDQALTSQPSGNNQSYGFQWQQMK